MDKRTARTRKALQDAFLSLLMEKRYADITVGDVLERSGVGRTTFYANFHGKDDLLELTVSWVCEHALAPTSPEHHHDFTGRSDPHSVIEHMLCHLRERQCGVHALLVGDNLDKLSQCLRDELAVRAETAIPAEATGPAAKMDRAFLVNHVAGSFVELVAWWAREGLATEPSRLADEYLMAVLPLFGKQLQDLREKADEA